MPGLVRRGRAAHHPEDVALAATIAGHCFSKSCVGNYRNAELRALWCGRVEITCHKCKTRVVIEPGQVIQPGQGFYPSDPNYRHGFKPFQHDEDAEHPQRDYHDFNRKRG